MYKKVFVICMLATTLMAVPADAGGLIKRPDLTIFSPLAVAQSPRAVAMGSAYATAADDVNAAWWNPAGMTGVEKLEVSLSHSQWFVNSTFNTGAIAYTSGVHTIGISILTFKPEDVEETTILQPGGTGRTLSLGTSAFSLIYSRKFTDKLSFGVRFMMAREDLDLTNHTTFNVDFGTKFYTGAWQPEAVDGTAELRKGHRGAAATVPATSVVQSGYRCRDLWAARRSVLYHWGRLR